MRKSAPEWYSISIHEDAERDLDRLYEEDEDAAAEVEVFLEEASCRQDILERFCCFRNYREYGAEGVAGFDIDRWKSIWVDYALWRLKLLDTPNSTVRKYRIIYTYHSTEQRYYILGVIPREFDYERHHDFTQRIIRAYRDLDIP